MIELRSAILDPTENARCLKEHLRLSTESAAILDRRKFVPESAKSLLFLPKLRPFVESSILGEDAKVATRLLEKSKHIGIFCDYDCDGILSSEVARHVFSGLGKKHTIFLPERRESYGLNRSALRDLQKKGVDTLITADCGTSNIAEILYAKTLGMTVIVTDHHEYSSRPPADAFLNPMYTEYASLCGCSTFGMALQSLSAELFQQVQPFLAIATIGDIVPMLQESRIFVSDFFDFPRFPGILDAAFDGVTDFDLLSVAFNVVPKINALSRMGQARTVLKFPKQTKQMVAAQLTQLNDSRKALQKELVTKLRTQISESDPIIVVNIPPDVITDGHGFFGLVASRLAEKYRKPAFVGHIEKGRFKGSGRSNGAVNIHSLLHLAQASCDIEFGGHSVALGFSAKTVDQFKAAVNTAYTESLDEISIAVIDDTDFSATLDDLSSMAAPFAELFPFGNKFPFLTLSLSGLEYSKFKERDFFSTFTYGDSVIYLPVTLGASNSPEKILSASVSLVGTVDSKLKYVVNDLDVEVAGRCVRASQIPRRFSKPASKPKFIRKPSVASKKLASLL